MKFAIVDSFPNIKNAETEIIIRIQAAAKSLGFECVVIDSEGYVKGTNNHLEDLDHAIDFILINHFISPSLFKHYSYALIWNPIRFLHDWGYSYTTRNILTCDDFLVYDSNVLTTHVRSMLRPAQRYSEKFISFVPSCSGPTIEPRSAQFKDANVFYCGINWERIGNKKGRHHDLFMFLDRLGFMRFYGPRIFAGAKPWHGFKGYQGDIPFDGLSVIKHVSEAGIALILSSDAHRESHAPTMRLYEACAAGAVIISDNNPFVEKYFGDAVLFVKYDKDHEKMGLEIAQHVDWIRNNPSEAEKLARRAQRIYLENYTLEHQLQVLSNQHLQRMSIVEKFEIELPKEQVACLVFLKTNGTEAKRSIESVFEAAELMDSVRIIVSLTPQALEMKTVIEGLNKRNFEIQFIESHENHFGIQVRNAMEGLAFFDGAVAFLQEGEVWYQKHLRYGLSLLNKNPKIDCVLTQSCQLDWDKKKERISYKLYQNETLYFSPSFAFENIVPSCTFMVKARFLKDSKLWPLDATEARVFQFLGIEAFRNGVIKVGHKVTSRFDERILKYEANRGKAELVEKICLAEYFRDDKDIHFYNSLTAMIDSQKIEKRIGRVVSRNPLLRKVAVRIWIMTKVLAKFLGLKK